MIANWLRREPGFFYDFLGVRTRVSYLLLPEWADGHIFGIPHPGERFLHSRAEWFGLLGAVDEASDRLVAAELGAGWGPWLVAAHAAARQKGIGEVHLIGVESSVDHAEMMRQHFADNGIDPKAHTILHAAAAPSDGTAWFPPIDPVVNWGQPAHFMPTAGMPSLSAVSLPTLLRDHLHVDFIHCDIQGSEGEVLPAAIDTLDEKVRRIVVGTHAPEVHDALLALFRAHGWTLEDQEDWSATDDGTQVWRNPKC